MGFFTGLDSEGYDRQYSDRQLITRMAGYFRPYGRRLLVATFLILLMALLGAVTPVIVARGVDALKQDLSLQMVILLSGAVFVADLLSWLANWGRRRYVVRMIGDIVLALRTEAFRAAAEHDLSFYDEYASGKVVSRITSDTQDFGQTVVMVTDIIAQFIQAIILGAVLISIEWRLALLLLAFMPVFFFL
jgi:ATP-binding cassette subfamily B protein